MGGDGRHLGRGRGLALQDRGAPGRRRSGARAVEWWEADIQAGSVGGRLHAVPFDSDALVLPHDKELLGAAGLLDGSGLPPGLEAVGNLTAALKARVPRAARPLARPAAAGTRGSAARSC